MIYTTIAHYGYNGLLISTFIAGIIIMCFAILKLGSLIKKIPSCIIIGFSFGLGTDILSGQLADFFGLQIHGGENFAKKITKSRIILLSWVSMACADVSTGLASLALELEKLVDATS